MTGKIIKNISNDYIVLTNEKFITCKPCGKLRYLKQKPLVGDNVVIENNTIMEIQNRKNSLVRPPVSNIDQAIIVTSVKKPDFDTNLLDKLLVIIEYNNIKPIICITKMDLLNKEETKNINKYIKYYQSIGYQVLLNTELTKIKKLFKDKISIFTGQSGSGKSTLLNKLDKNLNIETAPISEALNRGKHTTRHVELLNLCNGLIADTPGFSSVDFFDMTSNDIRDNFIEFNQFKDKCEYRDCMHLKEKTCEIKNQVGKNILESRYNNYIKFISR